MPSPPPSSDLDPQPANRRRMVIGAADMLRRRGLTATTIRELAKHTGAPLGSTYHYFPGGKEQLVNEAIRWAGDTASEILRSQLKQGPVEGLIAFIAFWRETIVSTGFRAGCPVLAVSVQEPDDDDASVLPVADEIFDSWQQLLATSLTDHGADPRQAAQLATLIVASLEGTVAMCRAKRSPQPLDDITPQLKTLVTTAIAR